MKELIILLLMGILGFACYRFGYKMAENKWEDIVNDKLSELAMVEINKIRELYDETYRNVFRHAVQILKEEISTNEEN